MGREAESGFTPASRTAAGPQPCGTSLAMHCLRSRLDGAVEHLYVKLLLYCQSRHCQTLKLMTNARSRTTPLQQLTSPNFGECRMHTFIDLSCHPLPTWTTSYCHDRPWSASGSDPLLPCSSSNSPSSSRLQSRSISAYDT